jgi:hypothetical protein
MLLAQGNELRSTLLNHTNSDNYNLSFFPFYSSPDVSKDDDNDDAIW